MPVYLELFHGRASMDEPLQDWGTEGPILGPLQYVHRTYLTDIKIKTTDGQDGVLSVAGVDVPDLLFYDGTYYGDWSVFSSDVLTDDLKTRVQQFDGNKAGRPKHPGINEVCGETAEKPIITTETPRSRPQSCRDISGAFECGGLFLRD